VAARLRDRGVPVLDLDAVARDVVAPGTPGLAEIAARRPSVVGEGGLDRRGLGAIVMADPAERRALEAITHPRIYAATEAWIAAQAAAGTPAVAVEAALMVETGSWRRYDRLLVVSCHPDTQRARLRAREGFDAATTERWLAAQLPLAEKERLAHAVIHNDGTRDALAAATDAAWAKLTASP
jgi:dephospho-CoA kinase